MKVIHLFTKFPNPYQPYNVQLIKRLSNGGISSIVYSFYRRDRLGSSLWDRLVFFFRGLLIIPLVVRFSSEAHKSFFSSLLFVGRLDQLRKNCDVIHIHHLQNLTKDHLIFLSLLGKPTVVSLRGSDALITPLVSEESMTSFLNALEFVDCVHVVSEHLAKTVIRYGAKPEKIHVIRRTPERLSKISSKVAFDGRDVNLTTIGRYNWVKGYPYLLQALRILVDDGCKVRLKIVGDGPREQLYEVAYWIDLLDLKSVVFLLGYKTSEEIDQILEETHVYVQPSVSEGIPNTLTRALFNSIPIVASRVGGIPEVVTEDNGILVPPGDSVALSEAIKKIIQDDAFRNSLYKQPMNLLVDPRAEIDCYENLYCNAIVRYKNRHG